VAAILGSGAQCEKSDLLAAMESPLDPQTSQHLQHFGDLLNLQADKA